MSSKQQLKLKLKELLEQTNIIEKLKLQLRAELLSLIYHNEPNIIACHTIGESDDITLTVIFDYLEKKKLFQTARILKCETGVKNITSQDVKSSIDALFDRKSDNSTAILEEIIVDSLKKKTIELIDINEPFDVNQPVIPIKNRKASVTRDFLENLDKIDNEVKNSKKENDGKYDKYKMGHLSDSNLNLCYNSASTSHLNESSAYKKSEMSEVDCSPESFYQYVVTDVKKLSASTDKEH